MPHRSLQHYFAFLRAINVGGHTVKMDHLRSLFEDLGFSGVSTFIASGNVIFEAEVQNIAALEVQIASHLRRALGYEVATFIRTASELCGIANYKPFPTHNDQEGSSLYIAFLHAPPAAGALQKLMTFESEVNRFHVQGRELYWLCLTRFSDSGFSGALLEKTLRVPATLRNATIRKLAARVAAFP